MVQDFDFQHCIDYWIYPYYENVPDIEGPQQAHDEDEDDFMERREEWIEKNKKLMLPDMECPSKPVREPKKLSLCEQYGKHGLLEVTIKLANIELTPEKPKYPGGVWHVKGQMVSVMPSESSIRNAYPLPNTWLNHRMSTLWQHRFIITPLIISPSLLFPSNNNATTH